MKNLLIILTSLFFLTSSGKSYAQDQLVRDSISEIIQNKQFIFKATRALPTSGRSRNLSFGYDLQVARDSIISHLPYFGRAYRAPVDPTKGGIQFVSTEFDYAVEEEKNGGWLVTILPKDNSDIDKMFLYVSENGYASLQVTSTFRQPISFNGRIEERVHLKAF